MVLPGFRRFALGFFVLRARDGATAFFRVDVAILAP